MMGLDFDKRDFTHSTSPFNFSTKHPYFIQKKALNLIQYLIQDHKADSSTATELGFPRLMAHLASSDDFSVREAALGALLELARDQTLEAGTSYLDKEAKLKQILQSRIDCISSMDDEDLGAAREERQLLDALWSACYDKPSPLREKGLVVLPGEESLEQPPDVAGKMFEPPLRAWAANNPQPLTQEKNTESPLLLGP